MKKIAIVLFVVAAALTACGKKKDAATPATGGAGSAMGSDMGSDMGSAAPMGSGDMGSGAMGGSGM